MMFKFAMKTVLRKIRYSRGSSKASPFNKYQEFDYLENGWSWLRKYHEKEVEQQVKMPMTLKHIQQEHWITSRKPALS